MASNGPGGLDELSRTLRRLRKDAGMSGEEAGRRAGFSQAKISRIEGGRNIPTPDDVATLACVYGASADTRRSLTQLAEAVKASYRRVVLARHPDRAAFQARIGQIEAASEQIRDFAPLWVPGLLQTPEYIQAIWDTGGGSAEEGAKFVANRLARQKLLADSHQPRRVTMLTTEGALGWAAGPPPMMTRQLEHIAAVIETNPTVRVGIIPFGIPARTFPVSSWTLYDERAAVPGVLGTQVVLHAPDVEPYVRQFEQLEPLAVYDEKARAILAGVADRYRALSG